MKNYGKENKNSPLISHLGFTLVEIVISVTISVIILTGVMFFLQGLQKDIITSEEDTRMQTEFTDFIGVMRNFSKLYDTGSLVIQGTGSYNAILLMRPDKTTGVLIGIVKESSSGALSRLDPESNRGIYGKKVLAYKKLTSSQIASILVNTGSVYNIDFSSDGLFKNLPVTDFTIVPYNSGSIFEYTIKTEVPHYPAFDGMLRVNIDPSVSTGSFTLDF